MNRNSERFQTLIRSKTVKIELITSCGQATPKGKWLKGRRGEWVMVLKGAAKLKFQKKSRVVSMKTGDHVYIPAGAAHRVEWTRPRIKTIWLAVHF